VYCTSSSRVEARIRAYGVGLCVCVCDFLQHNSFCMAGQLMPHSAVLSMLYYSCVLFMCASLRVAGAEKSSVLEKRRSAREKVQ
jgi:hypothetical protein